MGVTNLYITRHGQTEWNVEGKLQGHLDSPLTELGITQATQLANSLETFHFDAIYSSPSLRTIDTAEIIRGRRPFHVKVENRLREINMGSWEGMKSAEVRVQFPDEHEAFWNTPELYVPPNGGETFRDVYERVIPLIERITAHDGIDKTIMIVTHTVTLKCIMSYFEKRSLKHLWNPPFVHPASLSHVVIDGGNVTIQKYADMGHLNGYLL